MYKKVVSTLIGFILTFTLASCGLAVFAPSQRTDEENESAKTRQTTTITATAPTAGEKSTITQTQQEQSSGFSTQPASRGMTSGGPILVTSIDGKRENMRYLLGAVDTSTYNTSGLSWISDDLTRPEDGAGRSSESGRTVVFFVNGVQVLQVVAVAKIKSIVRVDKNTVTIVYNVDGGVSNPVTFTVNDGKLATQGSVGRMMNALIGNTNISY